MHRNLCRPLPKKKIAMSYRAEFIMNAVFAASVLAIILFIIHAYMDYLSCSSRKVKMTPEEHEAAEQGVESLLNTLGIKRESELEDELS